MAKSSMAVLLLPVALNLNNHPLKYPPIIPMLLRVRPFANKKFRVDSAKASSNKGKHKSLNEDGAIEEDVRRMEMEADRQLTSATRHAFHTPPLVMPS